VTSLINQLRKCWQNRQSARNILGKYGVQNEDDIKPLGMLTQNQALTEILNCIAWQMRTGECTEIRLTEPNEENVYTIRIENISRKGLIIQKVTNEPTLVGKVLHHWDNFVTYDTLPVFQIKASIECADALNSFNEDILQRKTDHLINEAIQSDLPNGCECDCCTFVSKMM